MAYASKLDKWTEIDAPREDDAEVMQIWQKEH